MRSPRRPGARSEFFDRHYVPLVTLLGYGNAAGLRPGGRLGLPLAYLARFEKIT